MENIKSSVILKIIAYTIIPFLIVIILINGFSILYYSNYEEDFSNFSSYFDTDRFASDYLSTIERNVMRIHNLDENHESGNALEIYDANGDIIYNSGIIPVEEGKISYELSNYAGSRYYDIVIIKADGSAITNIEKTINTDTIEKLKEYISSKKYYWKYDGKNVDTNIEKLSYNQIAYTGLEVINKAGYQVYTAVRNTNSDEFYAYNLLYKVVVNTYSSAPAVIMISCILGIIACAYIIYSIGHKKGEKEITTNGFDKIPYEIVTIGMSLLITIEFYLIAFSMSFVNVISTKMVIDSCIIMSVALGFMIYATLALAGVTTIRRIKAKCFWKNTIIYRLWIFAVGGLFTNFSQTVKLALLYGGFIFVSGVLFVITMESPVMVIVLLIFWYYVFKKLLDHYNKMRLIREKINNMYRGDIDRELREDDFDGELKRVARELNDISGGLSNAIEEATKSERLKTELITNVSHDIKTPLTSIINYVDLMKKEKIEDQKIQEYLEILDNKSQRLKKLTEDLVEASKASSGNIKLTMEKLNVKELIKQIGGEFEGKFEEKGLQVIESFPKEDVYIEADSRYMYRVMENMYTNIIKYALENSRVYIDVLKKGSKIEINLKNISKDKLNITVDELMQRFVRGDVSRTTEGSGLGISIAKSLTELQKGKFDIYLDGDLFKVVIEFEVK